MGSSRARIVALFIVLGVLVAALASTAGNDYLLFALLLAGGFAALTGFRRFLMYLARVLLMRAGKAARGRQAGPFHYAGRSRPGGTPAGAGGPRASPVSVYTVDSPAAPRTAGEAFEQHVWRREPELRDRRLSLILAALLIPAAVLTCLAAHWTAIEALFEGPPLRAWRGLLAVIGIEVLAVGLIALGLGSRYARGSLAFFSIARELPPFTVLQGRRDARFLEALKQVRPGVAGLPELFTVFTDRNGVLLLGGGAAPRVVAAFHWLHVAEIRLAPPDLPSSRRGSGQQRVELLIRHKGADVGLSFEVERAKVAWSEHGFVKADPLGAAVTTLQGVRMNWLVPPLGSGAGHGHADPGAESWPADETSKRISLLSGTTPLAGTDQERMALIYEVMQRAPLELASARAAWRKQVLTSCILAAAALGAVTGPGILLTLIG